jgi:hypothetical protein
MSAKYANVIHIRKNHTGSERSEGNKAMKPEIIKADASNKDWKYMALCTEHGFLLEAQTKKELATIKTMDFCNECYEVGA